MNDPVSQLQREPNRDALNNVPIGTELPQHREPVGSIEPVRPYVMPIEQANAQLTKGSIAGNLDHMLGGLSNATRDLITDDRREPEMRVKPT